MAGIGRKHRGNAAGHAFHGDKIGSAFTAIGEDCRIHVAQDRRHPGLRHGAKIEDRIGRQAGHRRPARHIVVPLAIQRWRRQIRAGEALGEAGPRAMPGAHQKRIAMAGMEQAKGTHHQILPLPVFELAAGEYSETAGKTAGPGPGLGFGMEQ